jgi:DNA-binding CsgD family transcriptional regulator
LDRIPPGSERAAALTLRVGLDFRAAGRLLGRAAAEAGDDELAGGRIIELQAYVALTYRGALAEAQRLEAQVIDIARRHGDEELEMLASSTLATAALLAGTPRPDLLERARALVRPGVRLGRWPEVELGRHALWGGDLGTAETIFNALFEMVTRAGIEFQRPYRLFDLALVEIAAGRLRQAAQLADDALESARDAGNEPAAIWARYPDGLARAHLGDGQRALLAARELGQWGLDHDEAPRRVMGHHVVGVLGLTTGDTTTACRELDAAHALATQLGQRHPGALTVLPDAVEAMAAAGDIRRAAVLAEELDGQASALGAPWTSAATWRGRGVVAAVRGERVAPQLLADATAAFDEMGYLLDAARSCRWKGHALRKLGRRPAAADAFADARDRFRTMNATPWERLVAAELDQVAPGRSVHSLTDTELAIATRVAAGERNREIAAALFVSVATVEAQLTRIYRKLGVRSRTELTRVVGERHH